MCCCRLDPVQHLDNITLSSQPYLLAQGPTRSNTHAFFIVIDKHALPCKATGSVEALDKFFKAHYVFGTSYSSSLTNFFTFVQTTIYNNKGNSQSCRIGSKNGALVSIEIKIISAFFVKVTIVDKTAL